MAAFAHATIARLDDPAPSLADRADLALDELKAVVD